MTDRTGRWVSSSRGPEPSRTKVLNDGALQPLEPRRESVTDIVYKLHSRRDHQPRLAPGAPVTEAALSAQLSVSKTPVREALLRLTHIGLIEPDLKRGSRVVEPSRGALRESYEVRIAVECEAARLVAERSLAEAAMREHLVHIQDTVLAAFTEPS